MPTGYRYLVPTATVRRWAILLGTRHELTVVNTAQTNRLRALLLTIHQRPFPPEDRSQPGHWEGDLIIGKDQGSAIGQENVVIPSRRHPRA